MPILSSREFQRRMSSVRIIESFWLKYRESWFLRKEGTAAASEVMQEMLQSVFSGDSRSTTCAAWWSAELYVTIDPDELCGIDRENSYHERFSRSVPALTCWPPLINKVEVKYSIRKRTPSVEAE